MADLGGRPPREEPLVEAGSVAGGSAPAEGGSAEAEEPVPWHFKLLVLALVLYLGFRLVQLVMWLSHHL